MPIKSISYQDDLLQALADPMEAAHYVNAAIEDSPDSFLMALRDVAQAKQMAKVAKEAGIQRETIYRSLSATGNPTWDTLSSVLDALGLTFNTAPKGCVTEPAMPPPIVPSITHERPQTEVGSLGGYNQNKTVTVTTGFNTNINDSFNINDAVWMSKLNQQCSEDYANAA